MYGVADRIFLANIKRNLDIQLVRGDFLVPEACSGFREVSALGAYMNTLFIVPVVYMMGAVTDYMTYMFIIGWAYSLLVYCLPTSPIPG